MADADVELWILRFCSFLLFLFLPFFLVVCVGLSSVAGRFQKHFPELELNHLVSAGRGAWIYFIFREILSMWNLSKIAFTIKFCHIWFKGRSKWLFLSFWNFLHQNPEYKITFMSFLKSGTEFNCEFNLKTFKLRKVTATLVQNKWSVLFVHILHYCSLKHFFSSETTFNNI